MLLQRKSAIIGVHQLSKLQATAGRDIK